MNIVVSKFINSYISCLPWVDKLAEVVKAVNVPYNTGDGQAVKTFPVSCGVSHNDCVSGKYADLIPSSKYKSIIYYEDGGTRFTDIERNYQHAESTLQMVCWLNLKALGQTECDLAALLISDLIGHLPLKNRVNYGPLISAELRLVSQETRNRDIFGRYTYGDYTQFLMYPYDYFALNFQVNYKIGLNCNEYESSASLSC